MSIDRYERRHGAGLTPEWLGTKLPADLRGDVSIVAGEGGTIHVSCPDGTEARVARLLGDRPNMAINGRPYAEALKLDSLQPSIADIARGAAGLCAYILSQVGAALRGIADRGHR